MSIESRSNQYGTVFEHWQIKEPLGHGSGGRSMVFRLHREDSPWETSALKVISLIEEKGNFDQLSPFRQREYQAALAECRQNAAQEVRLMADLRGHTQIVDYLDHKFVNWSDAGGYGCDMLIRMELLEDLRGLIRQGQTFPEEEVIKIGRDICQALMLCHRKKILHRDIKPENIFRSREGEYKLGDFGISRILDATPMSMASTGIGTPEYAAPEQGSGHYDIRVDIYSLGLVLYELSNGNRLPFASSGYIRPEEVQKRQMGLPLPPPSGAGKELADVILKACAYRPEDRYQSAQEFAEALNRIGSGSMSGRDSYQTVPADVGVGQEYDSKPNRHRKNTPLIASLTVLAVAIFCLIGAVSWMFGSLNESKDAPNADEITASAQTQTTPPQSPKDITEHIHHWTEATCTSLRTCTTCAETEGSIPGHSWIAATQSAPDTCEICGMTQGRSLGTPLTKCDIITDTNAKGSKTDVNVGNWVDCLGTTHYDALRFWVMNKSGWSNTESIVYDLKEQYQEMDVCIQLEENSKAGATAYVNIYLDGQLLKTSSVVDRDSSAVVFTIHVSGVDQICIECVTDASKSAYCIVEATLYIT